MKLVIKIDFREKFMNMYSCQFCALEIFSRHFLLMKVVKKQNLFCKGFWNYGSKGIVSESLK